MRQTDLGGLPGVGVLKSTNVGSTHPADVGFVAPTRQASLEKGVANVRRFASRPACRTRLEHDLVGVSSI